MCWVDMGGEYRPAGPRPRTTRGCRAERVGSARTPWRICARGQGARLVDVDARRSSNHPRPSAHVAARALSQALHTTRRGRPRCVHLPLVPPWPCLRARRPREAHPHSGRQRSRLFERHGECGGGGEPRRQGSWRTHPACVDGRIRRRVQLGSRGALWLLRGWLLVRSLAWCPRAGRSGRGVPPVTAGRGLRPSQSHDSRA
mmetsp:Transcript_16946/g.45618  ORF Transcript_16946/g.45618 Transcript_16946/m.45618 type:complete len:201 (+) Transcript_16946:347-949(+)